MRYRLTLNDDPSAAHASLVLELGDDILYRWGRDRKCDSDTAAGRRIDRGVHADDLALHIEGRTARIALVDRRIDLNEVVIRTASAVATARRNNAGRYGATKATRIADCN